MEIQGPQPGIESISFPSIVDNDSVSHDFPYTICLLLLENELENVPNIQSFNLPSFIDYIPNTSKFLGHIRFCWHSLNSSRDTKEKN